MHRYISVTGFFYSDSTWRQFVTFKMQEAVGFEIVCC